MSPHLVQFAAKSQMDDHLRSAGQRRLAAHARRRGTASAARASRRRLGLRSFRAVFGT